MLGICFKKAHSSTPGRWCRLLAGSLSSSPRGPPHRAVWTPLQHGSWLLPVWVIQERTRKKLGCLLWLGLRKPSVISATSYWLYRSALGNWEGTRQECEYQGMGLLRAILETGYHICDITMVRTGLWYLQVYVQQWSRRRTVKVGWLEGRENNQRCLEKMSLTFDLDKSGENWVFQILGEKQDGRGISISEGTEI